VAIRRSGQQLEIEGSHDGYAWLPGNPVHRRQWRFDDRALEVGDRVGSHHLPSVARYHLAPGLDLAMQNAGLWIVGEAGREIARVEILRGHARLEPSQHAQRFGELVDTVCLAVDLDGGEEETRWTWCH
jgi:hypothetical protein